MARFDIKTKGLQTALRNIRKAEGFAHSPGSAMKIAGAEMVRITQQTFRSQSDPVTGQKWPRTKPLAISTRAEGSREGTDVRSPRTLDDTGRLRQSLQTFYPQNPTTYVKQSTNRPGAVAHQLGMTITPKRAKFLWIPKTRLARRLTEGSTVRAAIMRLKAMSENPWPHFYRARSVRIPQRRFLGLSDKHTKRIGKLVLAAWSKAYGGRA